MKHLCALLIFFLVSSIPLHATPQVGDRLTLEDGTVLSVYGLQYPENALKKLREWLDRPENSKYVNSANWKGYFVDLSIREKKLHVDRIYVGGMTRPRDDEPEKEASLREIFGRDAPVLADWFSAELVYYHGERLGYTHVMDQMRVFTFKKGVLQSVEEKKTPRNR